MTNLRACGVALIRLCPQISPCGVLTEFGTPHGYGNMGCLGVALAMLVPSGRALCRSSGIGLVGSGTRSASAPSSGTFTSTAKASPWSARHKDRVPTALVFRTVGHGSNTTDGDSTSPGRFGRSSVRQPRPCADSHALEGTQRITRGHGLNHQSRPESDRRRRDAGRATRTAAHPRAPLRRHQGLRCAVSCVGVHNSALARASAVWAEIDIHRQDDVHEMRHRSW